jgi:predicted nucleic acid-binding protein
VAVLDTNVLLRYLTEDNAEQSERALRLLQLVESGQRSVLLTEAVLVETAQVLSSKRLYDIPRETVQLRLGEVIRMSGVKLVNKGLYLRALALFSAMPRLSFVDAILIAHAQRESDRTVLSFDQDFRNLPDVAWEQP